MTIRSTGLFLLALFISSDSRSLNAEDAREDEKDFVSLFDGKSLDGWQLVGKHGKGYEVNEKEKILVCPADGGGYLFSKNEYANFVLRFEFRFEPGGNNGVAIRCPLEGAPHRAGMEIQILDNDHEKHKDKLQPYQYHGSVYELVAAKREGLKPAGEWNREEIVVTGSKIKVTVNDSVIVDTDLADIKDEQIIKDHPGMKREKGHIGFLGHRSLVEFRNIRIKELK